MNRFGTRRYVESVEKILNRVGVEEAAARGGLKSGLKADEAPGRNPGAVCQRRPAPRMTLTDQATRGTPQASFCTPRRPLSLADHNIAGRSTST